MKIAVAAQSKKESSNINIQAGRSPFFLIFDAEGTLLESIKNPFSIGGGGAGFGVAKMLADRAVTTVVGGKFGSNMISALQERSILAIEMEGTVEEAVAKARQS